MNGYDAMFEEMRQRAIDFWNEIKDTFNEVDEVIERIEWDERMRDSWHVPKNIIKNHQVLNRKPIVSHIRNHI